MAMMSPMAGMSGGPQDLMKEAMDRKRAQVAQGQGQTPKPTSTSQINQQGSTPAQPPQQAAAPQQQTFAQMAAAGQARPAPPAPAPAPAAAPPAWAPATGATGNLREVMAQALGNPTGYGQADVQGFYNTAAEGIDDEFTQKERELKEQLARSGLDESSIMAGRTYDLNVGKRSAMADLANKYGENYARDFAANRQAAINSGVDLEGKDQDNALGIGRLGLDTSKLGLDTELGRGELDVKRQQAATDSSRVANDATYNMGRLAVDQGDLAFRRDDAAAERTRRADEFAKTYGLDVTKEERARQEFEKNYGLDERKLTQEEKDAEWQQYQDLLGFDGDTQTPWDDPYADPSYDPMSDLYYGQEPNYG